MNEFTNVDLNFTQEYASTLKQELGKLYEIVNTNRDSKMEKAKILYDRKVRAENFEKGTHVLLQIENKKIGENPSIAHK